MHYSKKRLLSISTKIQEGKKITPDEISTILVFDKLDKQSPTISIIKKSAVPLALTVGLLIAVFPAEADRIVGVLPSWTNLPPMIVAGADYFWNILSEPVGKANILYHLPNIILYSFGVLGVKKLFDAIDRRTWVDKVNFSKKILQQQLDKGTVSLSLPKGHSVLFLGNGDFIGQQFIASNQNKAVAVSTSRPTFTNSWNVYNTESNYDDLKTVVKRVCSQTTGEYIFFPVKDDQLFLPGPTAYDLSPHRLDILCQDIRSIEKENHWKSKKIIVVGDKLHKSFVQSEDKRGKVKGSEDDISVEAIVGKYDNVSLVDPTDIVLTHILKISKGRKIVFRATKEGIKEYKERFYKRLATLGYKDDSKKRGILTIGYDLFEDQTEQQTLSKKVDDYFPVVLSKAVSDALIRNGYKKEEFIYVPDLVLAALKLKAEEQ